MVMPRRTAPGGRRVEGIQHIPIANSGDIVLARQAGRTLAAQLDFSASDLTIIATAISEVARNIVEYAGRGEIMLEIAVNHTKQGLLVVARDHGPGIPDVSRALQVGFSTGKGLGLGLPGVRRLMDEFTVASHVGRGTVVTMIKWAP
jgi:serine/threonine-protein kinase RsbT